MYKIDTRPRLGSRKVREKMGMSFYLSADYNSQLSNLAEEAGISKANLIEIAIMHLIDNGMIEVSGVEKSRVTIVS